MREKFLDAIYKRLEKEPENLNLQRQINLLPKSSICTIHSFCLDVVKNNFFETNISPNFRIGSEEEFVLMKQEVLDDLFDKKYEENDEDFLKLVDKYCGYKDDDNLKNLILRIYSFSMSSAFPDEWLKEKQEMFNVDLNQDFSKTIWGKILVKELDESAREAKNNVESALEITTKYEELSDYTLHLEEILNKLREFKIHLDSSWDEAFEYYQNTTIFPNWPSRRNITIKEKEEAKQIRDCGKEILCDCCNDYLKFDSKSALRDIKDMYNTIKALCNLVLEFDDLLKKEKREKNIIDFNDIEHYCLNILVKKDENGDYVPTEVAKNYSKKFEEIAIDEYQDSNNVQEQILTSISRGNNIFTVGDVKQSIYRFRRACPELFLDKYHKYSLDGNENGLKIKLFKNFRSRKNILDVTNSIFESIMSSELGEIDYTEDEFLNLGAEYQDSKENVTKSEVIVIENNRDIQNDEESNNQIEEIQELKEEEIEARFISNKIKELIKSKVLVTDKKVGQRPIKYKDIVILMRSTKERSTIYEKELLKNNIPVFSDGDSEYLDTIEIQTIMNLLKILDNELDDISLVSVLRSTIFEFTDNEILEMRLVDKEDCYFWDSIVKSVDSPEISENLKEKLKKFIAQIKKWKEEKDYIPISEFIWKIYVETGFYNYCRFITKWKS